MEAVKITLFVVEFSLVRITKKGLKIVQDEMKKSERSPIWSRNFNLLFLANLALFMSIQVLLPTLPIYLLDIGGDEKDVGFVMGAFTITAMAVRPGAGWFLDRYGRKKVLLLGIILMLVSSVLYQVAAAVLLLILVRAIHGLSYSVATTATGTMVADILPRSRIGEGMGYFGLTSTLSMALAPLFGLWLVKSLGYDSLFIGISLLSLLALLSSMFVGSAAIPARTKTVPTTGPWDMLLEKKALPASGVMFFLATVFGAVIAFISIYAEESGISNVGVFFTANALAMMISRPFSGRWVDKNGADGILLIGYVFIVTSMLTVVASNNMLGFVLAGLAYGAGFGICIPTLQTLTVRDAAPHRRGAATATFFGAFDLGIGVGTIIWGYVAALTGYRMMFLLTIVPVGLAGLFHLYFKRKAAKSTNTIPLTSEE